MNKAQRLLQLTEMWAAGFKARGIYQEIFTNPDRKELANFERYPIRFFADNNTKKVHVFDAEVLHDQAAPNLGYSKVDERPGILAGVAEFKQGKYIMIDSDVISHGSTVSQHYLRDLLETNWTWTERYISGVDRWIKRERGT